MAGFSFTLFIQNAVELGQNWNAFDGCGAKVKNVRRAQDPWNSGNYTEPVGQDNETACKWYLASLVLLGLSMFLQCTHAIMCFCNTNPQLETNSRKMTGNQDYGKVSTYFQTRKDWRRSTDTEEFYKLNIRTSFRFSYRFSTCEVLL